MTRKNRERTLDTIAHLEMLATDAERAGDAALASAYLEDAEHYHGLLEDAETAAINAPGSSQAEKEALGGAWPVIR